MFKIYDGRDKFYQWDLDRQLIIEDPSITQVHFTNRATNDAYVCETYVEDGKTLVNVPNILLQTNWRIQAYAYDGKHTKHDVCYEVVSRSKPNDYVYTETEILDYKDLEEKINEAAEAIGVVEAELSEQLLEKVTYKGEIEEALLPTGDSSEGDMYKLAPKTYLKAYGSFTVRYHDWTEEDGYYFASGFNTEILTEEEYQGYQNVIDNPEEYGWRTEAVAFDIYNADWEYVATQGINYDESPVEWVFNIDCSKPNWATLGETYYCVRADENECRGTLPTHSFIVENNKEVIANYAIYNGNSFDKFYTQESVDKKVAEVESAKADVPKPYELIETVTLTEDVTEINLKTEPDGTPYNFDKILIYATVKKASGKDNLRWNVNGAYFGSVTNGIYSDWNSLSIFEAYGDKQVDKMVSRLGNFTNSWSNITNLNTTYVYGSRYNSIKLVRFFAYNVPIPTGTTFEIWGVRA